MKVNSGILEIESRIWKLEFQKVEFKNQNSEN